MRIEPFVSGDEMHFVVKAENATDRALLTQFTRSELWQTHELRIGSHTYECDYSATIAFNFGWVAKSKIAARHGLMRKIARLRSGLLPGLFKSAGGSR